MRIPSQFNEDSLYRRGRRGDESAQTYRRLIRLLIGLVLVIVVMRQASRPAIYETFFGAQASTAARSGDSLRAGSAMPLRAAETSAAPIDPENIRIAQRLTLGLQTGDQRQWVVTLVAWESGRVVKMLPPTAPALLEQLGTVENLSDESRHAWEAMFQALAESAMSDEPSAPAAEHRACATAFLAALDEAAAARVVDGSVWRSGDFDAFYRYLDQAETLSGTDVAATGVLPLLQQPDVFRNQLVRARGGVARAERIEATENPYGIRDYWQLWLRPSDGADRPMVVIVPSVPTLVAAVGPDAIVQEGPQVTIVGRFLKRLAYESAMGADLAPVVVGRIASAPMVEQEFIAESSEARSSPASGRMWLIIAAAGLAGFALAALTMWRTSVMAKRARQLRTQHRKEPDEFLRGLRNSAGHELDDHPAS